MWQHILSWLVRTHQTPAMPPSCHALGKFWVTLISVPPPLPPSHTAEGNGFNGFEQSKKTREAFNMQERKNSPTDAQNTPPVMHGVGAVLVWPRNPLWQSINTVLFSYHAQQTPGIPEQTIRTARSQAPWSLRSLTITPSKDQ